MGENSQVKSKVMLKQKETKSWSSYNIPIYYQQIEWELGNLLGKVLTVVDSSIQEQTQRKAMKDLVKEFFSKSFFEFQRQGSEGKAGHSVKVLESIFEKE